MPLGIRGFRIDESLFLIKIVYMFERCDVIIYDSLYDSFTDYFCCNMFFCSRTVAPVVQRTSFHQPQNLACEELSERWLLQEMVTGGKFLKDLKTYFSCLGITLLVTITYPLPAGSVEEYCSFYRLVGLEVSSLDD